LLIFLNLNTIWNIVRPVTCLDIRVEDKP